jgi:hypothetical protein
VVLGHSARQRRKQGRLQLWNPFLWRVHLLFLLLLLRLLLLLHHASAHVLLLLVDGEFFTFENLTIFI